MSKIDLIDSNWVDLVIERKNKEYGAYKLRKNTGKRNIWAIIIMLAIAALLGAIIGVNAIIEASKAQEEISADVELSNITKKEVKVEKKAPVKMEEFVPPVIKKDSEVKPEEELKSQDDLNQTKTAIGSFDVKGNDDTGGEVLKAKEVIAQPEPPKEEETKVFDVVEVMPSFPGGDAALQQYLGKNIKYPVVAEENGVQGRVVLTFVVERDGSISDIKVVRSVDPSLDKEATRVVKSMPKWIPGKQNGSAVRVKFTLPVTFRLQ